jgi:glycosyltransferase involved in cell wall biosynthesis
VTEGRSGGLPLRLFSYFAGSSRRHVWGYASSMNADRALRPAAIAAAPIVFASALAALRRRLGSERYDVVHAHWVLPNGPIAALGARAMHRPLVVSLHGSDVFVAERHRWLGWLATSVLRRSHEIIACSTDLAARARALARLPREPEVLPYGVDPEEFAGGNRARWRARSGAGEGEFLAVGLGRLVAKKGFRHLIAAAAAAATEGVPIRVAIAGSGGLRDELEAEAKRLGSAERVRFLGSIPHAEVGGLLAAADVVVVPSVRDEQGNVDGLPNVLMEALVAGKPAVATAIAGIPEVVRDGESGLLVPAGDSTALAAALRRLHADTVLRARLGATAREAARGRSWRVYGERLVGLYARALADDGDAD